MQSNIKQNNGSWLIESLSLKKDIAFQRSIFLPVIICILLIAFIPVSQAAEEDGIWQNISNKVTVNTANPQRSRRSPDAKVNTSIINSSPSDLAGPLRLVIKNLTSGASVSISNATGFTDSGEPYFDLTAYVGNDFIKGTTSDVIVVHVAGGRNVFSFTPIVEQLEEAVAPELAIKITSPATLGTVGASPITIQGTLNDPNATLTVNGVTVSHNNGQFSASVALDEGHNTLLARAVAANGTETTDSISIALDTTPPIVTIESPLDGATVNNASIAVSGLINDIVRGTVSDSQGTVVVNGQAATISNRSYLAQAIALTEGENTITVTGSDEQGNTSSTSITINYEVPAAKQIALVSGQNQTDQILSVLSDPLKVKLVDNNGNPVADANVIYRVVQGDGVAGVGTDDEGQGVLTKTDASGIASTQFKLGARSGQGNHRVRAKAVGFDNEVVFYASANTNPGNKVSINSGNNQRGAPNQALPQPLIVAITDQGANLVQGAEVEFKVTVGGGMFQNGASSIVATTDSDGRASASLTLGEEIGLDVHRVTATLIGTSLNAGFTASALEQGDPGQTSITGVVLDNQDNPLPNVSVRVDGNNRQGITNSLGLFKITEVPVGPVHLIVDGSTTTIAGEWPTLSYNIVTIAGAENPLSTPVYMVKLNTENAVFVGREDKSITLDEVPGFKLEVKARSVTFPDGAREGLLSVTTVNASKVPMAPPNGMQPQFIVTIQPSGARFDPPAPLTFPNVDGHLPGAQVEMYSYDHDLEEFVTIGLGTVSTDGSLIRSNIGVGVIKAGWHCGSQPGGSGCANNCAECKKCDGNCNCVKDDSQTPKSNIIGDCKKAVCGNGTVKQEIDDSDIPENDKCKFCENGLLKEKDSGAWLNDDSLSASVALPDGIKNKIESTINKFPGVNITLKETKGAITGRIKDCCDPSTGGFKDKGLKEGEGSFTVSAELKNLKLWPAPTVPAIHIEENLTAFGQIFEVQVVLDAGVFFNADFTVDALGGKRVNQCLPEDCLYGSFTANVDIALLATAHALTCFDSTLTKEYCGEIKITPAKISTGVTGGASYNIPLCSSGLNGVLALKPVVFSVEISLGILPDLNWSEQIYPF